MMPQEALEKARAQHGGKYDYSTVEYVNRHGKVRIGCPEHGEFFQDTHSHLKGAGCPACGGVARLTTEAWVAKALEKFGGRYGYEKVQYVNAHTKVTITCREHGDFEQTPHAHIRGKGLGCPTCEGESVGARRRTNVRARLEALGFDVVNAGVSGGQVTLRCKKHGEYTQRAGDTLYKGSQCPRCAVRASRKEKEIAGMFRALGFVVETNTRKVIPPREIDIWLPELRLGVEYNGILYHSDKFMKKRTVHLDKQRAVEAVGGRLVQVFEDEYLYRRDAVRNALRCIVGKAPRVFARKCDVVWETAKDVAGFLDDVHVMGAARHGEAVSLFHGGVRVASMVFSSAVAYRGGDSIELARFASDGVVVGGASRLFSAYVAARAPETVVSYSDNRWYKGQMYAMLGFSQEAVSRPSYTVLENKRRNHKSNYTRAKLKSRPEYREELSEREICAAAGLYRVYDCGTTRWVWRA